MVEDSKEAITKVENHTFWFYSKPSNFAKIIRNRKLIFGMYGLIGYLG